MTRVISAIAELTLLEQCEAYLGGLGFIKKSSLVRCLDIEQSGVQNNFKALFTAKEECSHVGVQITLKSEIEGVKADYTLINGWNLENIEDFKILFKKQSHLKSLVVAVEKSTALAG